MRKKYWLILGAGLAIVIAAIILFQVTNNYDTDVKYSEYTIINTTLYDNCKGFIVVSSDELQKSVEDDYNITLGQQDYSKHSLILAFEKKLKSLTVHIGSHPEYYKPAVRKSEELNFSDASYEDGNYEDTIFVYITDRTDIVSWDEFGYTCWD